MDDDTGELFWMIQMCERFGWALDYVRDMPPADMMAVMGYISGLHKVEEMRAMKAKTRRG